MGALTQASGCFMAGAAREDITPPVGTLLYGYVPDSVSTSVHDGLEAVCAAFAQGDVKVLLVTISVGDFGTELCDELRARIGKENGLPAGRVVIAATHTHSAPNVSGIEGWGDIDRGYVDNILFPRVCEACRRALDDLQPAELAIGTAESKVGINRRQQYRDGSIGLGQNPWGCFDPEMTVLALRNRDNKKGIINIIHYGCHGTAAGNNREISRDWPGIMTDRLTAETGTLSAFFNGTVGDVGPRLTNGWTTGDIKHVEELGGVAAADAVRAYRNAGVYKTGDLRQFEGVVSVPRKPLPPVDVLRQKLAAYSEPEKLINISRLEYAYYRAAMDEYEAGCPPYEREFCFGQTLISLGDVVFVPFPFEIFSEIALRLRAYSPFRHTLTLSNANGYNAYLPTEDQLVRGGYEVACFRFSSAHPLADNADQILIDRTLALLSGQ
ncbi:MAG: neutral/alkaline non-lysosomal ceramidase N-terminal domain-containing protein [Clostridia bacterium]|nr:neutral/alkaline non-lysosomal ceramidase N-terminal domain-containing protein [Clostridia bacterium]